MADKIGPFDGVAYEWSMAEWYRMAPLWAPSGIVGSPASGISSGAFAVTASGLTATVAAAGQRAWADGTGYLPDSNKAVPVPANGNASLSRRDRIVLRRDLNAKTCAPVLLQGAASATPAAPDLTRISGGVFDVPICSFLTPPNNNTTLSGFVDERTWLDPAGQPSVYGSTGLAALVGQADTVAGLRVYESSTKRHWRYDGAAFQYAGGAPPPIVPVGNYSGWTPVPGQEPGAYKDASGLCHLVGAMTNDNSYFPDGRLMVDLTGLGMTPARDIGVLILLPVGGGSILGGVYADGKVKVNYNNGVPIPVNTVHTFSNITWHPGFDGGALA